MTLLTVDQLGEVLDRTRPGLLRIETLPSYDTAMTTGGFRRWLDGEAEPTRKVRQPWGHWSFHVDDAGHATGRGRVV
ncbi:MAG: DUF6879 family protein [Pseudonocardiaceae bacterium]